MGEVLTERQIQIIKDNLSTFGDDLRVGTLDDFDPASGDWLKSGSVFLYVHNAIQHRHYDYPTSLGHYDNPDPILVAVREMIWAK